MHPMDNCLESTGGDILEMSCTGIISIALVRAGCHSKQAKQAGRPARLARRREIYYGFHQQGTIGWDTLVVQRLVIISVIYLKSNSGNNQKATAVSGAERTTFAFHRCLCSLEKRPVKTAMC